MIQVVHRKHPDFALIESKVPELALNLSMRTEVKGIKTRPHEELAQIVIGAMYGAHAPFRLVTAGPCLVGMNINTPWWGNDAVLSEEFVVWYKPGNFKDTLQDLETHAKEQGCKYLVLSSLASIREISYGEYLKRKGFKAASREFVKEIAYGKNRK